MFQKLYTKELPQDKKQFIKRIINKIDNDSIDFSIDTSNGIVMICLKLSEESYFECLNKDNCV